MAPPHPKLNREQSIDWRRLQTSTYPNLHTLSKIHLSEYRDECPWCGGIRTLRHITYSCPSRPAAANSALIKTHTLPHWSWEARLSDQALGSQLAILDQARRAAIASGALDEGHHPL